MEAEPLIAGLDAGSSRIRALVFTPAGEQVAAGSAPTPTRYPQPGWAEHDAEALWEAAAAALRDATSQIARPQRIAGLAVAGVGEAIVLLDKRGMPTHPVIAWFDQRAVEDLDRLQATLGAQALFDVTGLFPEPLFGLCKILWLQRNAGDALGRSAFWLNLSDYLAWRLCGEAATDLSLASRSMLLDLRTLTWSQSLLQATGVREELLQPVLPSGTALGKVQGEVAAQTGLPRNCVVGVGGHDHMVGALAVDAWRRGTLLDSLGTAEVVMLAMDAPVFAPELLTRGYSQGALQVHEPRYYVIGAMNTSGACVEWFRDTLGQGAEHCTLIAEGEAVPPGSHGAGFFPQMRGGTPPVRNASARGAFYGLVPDMDRATLYRALLEGLALDAANVTDHMLALPGIPSVTRLLAVGGSTQNALLMKIKAAVMQRPIEVVEMPEAVSVGAALLGGLAAGVFESIPQAVAGLTLPRTVIAPEPQLVRIYRESLRRYREVPAALAALHKPL